jgi:acyl-coenzyme A synthetase/AMP-(fatty) acid ligase
MNLVDRWSLLVGAGMPVVIAFVMHRKMPQFVRAVLAVLACLVAGAITVAVNGSFHSGTNAASAMVLVVLAAVSTYEHFWKPTGIAPWIERVTSFLPKEGDQAAPAGGRPAP